MSTAHMDRVARRRLQQGFKLLNRFMVLMWRLDLGWLINAAPKTAGQILVINHIGRKSGLKRRTPVNYALVDDEVYCVAGFGHVSDWYRNVKVRPEIEIWLPGSRWKAVVTEVTDDADYLRLVRAVLIGSGFAARAAGINPHTLSDEQLAAVTEGYRLLRLHRTQRINQHGDLVWIWPLTMVVGIWCLRRRNHPPASAYNKEAPTEKQAG